VQNVMTALDEFLHKTGSGDDTEMKRRDTADRKGKSKGG